MQTKKRNLSPAVRILSGLCICAFLALLVLLIVPAPKITEPEVTQPETTPRNLPVTGDGDPESLTCRASYSSDGFDPDAVAARLGTETLTAGQLQAIYYLELCAVKDSVDWTVPLDEQVCPLSGTLSWQHYLLQRALADWQLWQGLELVSREPMPVTEELFQPNAEDHAQYLPAGIPAERVLYADRDCFTPNEAHQGYLDGLGDLVQDFSGISGVRDTDLLYAAELMNRAYMFFTEMTWEAAKSAGQTADTVSVRDCLILPKDAANEISWQTAGNQAKQLLRTWSKSWLTTRNSDANFARLANENSADTVTAPDGGLLTGLRDGDLPEALNTWCFDEDRKPGDTTTLRDTDGWHILYFRERVTEADAEAGTEELRTAAQTLLDRAESYGQVKADYGSLCLAPVEAGKTVTVGELLYPDVGFERFPEVPLYFQQDYGDLRFGKDTLAIGGCGITSFSMLATYMTDTVYTPAMMAERFKTYASSVGTDGTIFLQAPAELGFYSAGQPREWDTILKTLQAGDPIVSLQIRGIFTASGHFLVLAGADDDGIIVRDPNLKNYNKLDGFRTDRFTKADIQSGAVLYYAFQPKLVTIPGCTRCGTEHTIAETYLCRKCAAAEARREAFLELNS